MTEALEQIDAKRHPWLETLEASPDAAVTDVMAGYAAVFPYTRADAPDALRMLIGHLSADDPARAALASGLMNWLQEMRQQDPSKDPAFLQDHVRQVTEAMEIISLLELVEPAIELRTQYVRWFEWVSRLNMGPSRDARASYMRMLAITQPVVAEYISEPDALAAFWMRICRESGSIYPKSYLQIGLLGLRRLPGALDRGETPWIAGLAAWALVQDPTDKQFLRAWRPIKRLYPASPKILRRNVFNVLSQRPYADAEITPPGWWANDTDDFPNVQDTKSRTRSLEPPAPDLREGIVQDLRDGATFLAVREKLTTMVERYERYTDATADDYFLVRSFCNVGNMLLRHSVDALAERAKFAERLARLTLRYQPRNPIAWALWRDALFSAGAFEASVALGWETVRRFPNNPLMRNELAEILLALGRVQEAQDVVEDGDATQVFDIASYSVLSRIYANLGDTEGAREAISTGLQIDPDDRDLLLGLECLRIGKQLPLVSNSRKKVLDTIGGDGVVEISLEFERSARLRMLRQRLLYEEDAVKELQDVLNSDPTFAYAQILAARHKIWHAEEHALPPVAAAFEEALANGDLGRLEALAEQMPRLQSLILLARAILGDGAAAREVAGRLGELDEFEGDDAAEILRDRFKPVFRLIDGGLKPEDAVMECAEQLRIVIYDANEALSAPELLVA